MKILSVHNSYQTPGGEDQVFAREADLLRSHGHQVLLYQASNDQVRDKTPWSCSPTRSGTGEPTASYVP